MFKNVFVIKQKTMLKGSPYLTLNHKRQWFQIYIKYLLINISDIILLQWYKDKYIK